MRADRLRSGDYVVFLAVKVGSVLVEDGLVFVTYDDDIRTGEVLEASRQVMVIREEKDDA